jgi:signal transduction histidine kinase
MTSRTGSHRLSPLLLVGATLLLAIIATLALTERAMGAPPQDIAQLSVILTGSGAASLIVGALAVRWARRLGRLRWQIATASGVGLLVAVANVLTASALMFLSTHDLTLLVLLLAFTAVVSLIFAYAVTGVLTTDLQTLSEAAQRLADGHLEARAALPGTDEIAHLGAAFDRMADGLARAFERERALEAGRRELVIAVSHDLRTPLATTRAMVEALADGLVSEPADVQRYLSLIQREIQHLSRLIDDLFSLSQIESGALHMQVAPVEVGRVLSRLVAAYQAPARARGVRLDVAAETVPQALADEDRFEQALRNLLDNALRHTPAGGLVRIQATASPTTVEIVVADSGPGIPPDERERVFERFYRGGASRSRGDGADGGSAGAGLGLALAQALVHAQQGRIWAGPSDLGGAALHITLPRTRTVVRV